MFAKLLSCANCYILYFFKQTRYTTYWQGISLLLWWPLQLGFRYHLPTTLPPALLPQWELCMFEQTQQLEQWQLVLASIRSRIRCLPLITRQVPNQLRLQSLSPQAQILAYNTECLLRDRAWVWGGGGEGGSRPSLRGWHIKCAGGLINNYKVEN